MAYDHTKGTAAESLGLAPEQLTETTKIIAEVVAHSNRSSNAVEEIISKLGITEDAMKLVTIHCVMLLVSDNFRDIVSAMVSVNQSDATEGKEEHECEECDIKDCENRTAPYSIPAADDTH